MRVYLAGPMRGHKNWNFDEFERVAKIWRDKGHIVVSPHDIVLMTEGCHPDLRDPKELEFAATDRGWLTNVIAIDILMVARGDAIALLSGWETSSGATVKLAVAQFLSLPVYCAITMKEIVVPKKPWHRD